jgi:hypothetical protein
VQYFSVSLISAGFLFKDFSKNDQSPQNDSQKVEEEKLLQNLEEKENMQFYARLSAVFAGSPRLFVDALVDQDERCLLTLCALLQIGKK